MAETDKKRSLTDISIDKMFLTTEVIPNASRSFLGASPEIDSVKDEADIALDASALLLPYIANSESLKKISALYKKLDAKGQLVIPAQAAREFVINRPNKISELQQSLLDKMSTIAVPEIPSYPILEGLPEYQQLIELSESAQKIRQNIKNAANRLVDLIRGWEWNDPVSKSYREAIRAEAIVECSTTKEDIRNEMIRRYEHSIPPGYKDAGKPDGGVGDFLIWKTILEIAEKNKRPLIFVSGDGKADWQYSSKNQSFLPRVELVAEYQKVSGGHMFYMIPLSKLLNLFEGESSSVADLRQAEERLNDDEIVVTCPNCLTLVSAELGSSVGSSALPRCSTCFQRFHVNRTRDGILVQAMGRPTRVTVSNAVIEARELEFCPNCENLVEFLLETKTGARRWVRCNGCNVEFPVAREKDGTVTVSHSFTAVDQGEAKVPSASTE